MLYVHVVCAVAKYIGFVKPICLTITGRSLFPR